MFCLFICLFITCVPDAIGGQKRALDSLDWSYKQCELPCEW